jgi:hypothetical protein
VLLSIAALWAVFGNQLAAQSITSGDIAGTVTDQTAAAITNASVTLTNTGTNTSQQASTGANGTYRFAFLPSGRYSLSIKAQGFQTQERRGIVVTAGQPTIRKRSDAGCGGVADGQRG